MDHVVRMSSLTRIDVLFWNETLYLQACVWHQSMLLVMIHCTSRRKRSPFSKISPLVVGGLLWVGLSHSAKYIFSHLFISSQTTVFVLQPQSQPLHLVLRWTVIHPPVFILALCAVNPFYYWSKCVFYHCEHFWILFQSTFYFLLPVSVGYHWCWCFESWGRIGRRVHGIMPQYILP